MQHEANSLNTKRTLAEELRRQANTMKKGEKITVNSLSRGCKINRNTFYYHFSNIKELILWTLRSDLEQLRQFHCSDGHEIRLFTLDYLEKNRKFLNYAFLYVGFEDFHKTHTSALYTIVMDHILYQTEERGGQVDPEKAHALATAYAEMLTALFVWHFREPNTPSRFATATAFDGTFTYAIPGMLQRLD